MIDYDAGIIYNEYYLNSLRGEESQMILSIPKTRKQAEWEARKLISNEDLINAGFDYPVGDISAGFSVTVDDQHFFLRPTGAGTWVLILVEKHVETIIYPAVNSISNIKFCLIRYLRGKPAARKYVEAVKKILA